MSAGDKGFGILPRHLAGSLTLTELGVYVALTWHADSEGICFPSHATIAREIGASVSSVRRGIEGLVAKNLLVKKGRVKDDGGQTSNLYLLNVWREQGGWSHRTGGVLPENNERDSSNETHGGGPHGEITQFSLMSRSETRPKKKAATRVDPSWQPDDHIVKWTREHCPDIDPRVEWQQFIDHALANDRRQVDWTRAWFTWARKAQQWAAERAAQRSARRRGSDWDRQPLPPE